MNKTIIVRFMRTDGALDLYKCQENGRVYARIPVTMNSNNTQVQWTTTSLWSGGYEPDTPIRAGITMQVKDYMGEPLFSETLEVDDWLCSTSAKKVGPFSSEALSQVVAELQQRLGLHTYKEWKKWLLESKPNGMDSDYWMLNYTDIANAEVLETVTCLGRYYRVVCHIMRHTACGKTYRFIELSDMTGTPQRVVGYQYLELDSGVICA